MFALKSTLQSRELKFPMNSVSVPYIDTRKIRSDDMALRPQNDVLETVFFSTIINSKKFSLNLRFILNFERDFIIQCST